MAIEDSKLSIDLLDPFRSGVIIGTGIGGGQCKETQHMLFMEKGIKRISPLAAVMICTHSAAGIISCELGLKGLNSTISSGCTAGLDAIYSAYNAIRLGDADIMLAGAGEAPITPYIVALFWAGGILTGKNGEPDKALTPFDIRGDGTVLGEGGAILILEELQNALRREGKIYGEILGYSSGNEAYNIFEIDPSGDASSILMKKGLQNAYLKPQEIDYINAHGSGLLEYDVNETKAIKRAFGEFAYNIPISSIKPITGQSFSVTGILQVITSLLVINNGVIPPTMNHTRPPEGCDLDYVPQHFRKRQVSTVFINAHGFCGGNTIMIVGKYK